jgi:hypothetical protein
MHEAVSREDDQIRVVPVRQQGKRVEVFSARRRCGPGPRLVVELLASETAVS